MPPPAPTTISTPGSLVDHAVELVKLACTIEHQPADAEALRVRCDQLLVDFAARAQRAGYALDLIDAAKYAFVALIDERILASDHPAKTGWLENPLQMKHFDSFAAGEEFYTRLEAYRHGADPKRCEVLEVFHICLALGFAGKLGGETRGHERRRMLLDQIANEIATARGTSLATLAPNWAPAGEAAAGADLHRWHGLPVWLVPIAAGVLVALTWLAANAWVGGAVESFIRDVPVR